MQHTLIPTAERQKLHREYYMRVAIVLVAALALSLFVGCGALFPAFISAWSRNHAAENAVITAKGPMDEVMTKDKAELTSDAALLSAIPSSYGGSRYTDVINALVSLRQSVTFDSISLDQRDKDVFGLALNGVAPTRGDLLSFKARLGSRFPTASIDIPIDQLAKGTNLPFSLRFALKMP